MKNGENFVVIDENGKEQAAEILFTHEYNGKNYVVFKHSNSDDLYASAYVPGEDESMGELLDIETDEEYEMLQNILDEYEDSYDESEGDFDEDFEEEEDDDSDLKLFHHLSENEEMF